MWRICAVAVLLVGCDSLFGIHKLAGDAQSGSDAAGSDGGGDGGGSSGTARREPITIQGAMLTGTHTDFPVWIALSGSEVTDLVAHARANGADIFFTDGTNSLDYELQRWDPASSLLQAWVRLPTVAHGTNVTIYVEYGDLALAPGPNPKGVFTSSYVAVWHLDDTLQTNAIVDSVGTSPGTAVALGSAASQPGELGRGIAFDGTGSSMITFANHVTGDTPSVISAWVQAAETTHTGTVAVLGTGATDESRFLYAVAGASGGTGLDVAVGLYMDDWYPNGPNLQSSSGAWSYLVWYYAGTTVNHVFVNGAEIAGSPHDAASAANTTGAAGYLGYAPEGTVGGQYGAKTGFLGVLDEVRIATGSALARDAGWFATEYANQSSPATFYTVGAAQTVP